MKFVWRCAPIVLALAVTACSQQVAGTPGPQPADASPTFGVRVPAGDRQKLDLAEQIRSVDPCGFFDQNRISAVYGQISTLGPDARISTCEVGVLQFNRKQVPSRVTIDMASYPPTDDEGNKQIAGETVTIDGVRTSHGNCAYKVPMRFPVRPTGGAAAPDIVEVPTVAYVTVSSAGFTPDTLGCQLVEETVTNIVTAFRDNKIPRRTNTQVDVPLTRRSPCELMQHLPAGLIVEKLEAETEPYECRFQLRKPGKSQYFTDMVSAGFKMVSADTAMKPFSTFVAAQVDGKPVLIDRDTAVGEPRCSVWFAAGPVVDTYRPGAPATASTKNAARWQPIVTLLGPCRVTDTVTPAALKLFGANG
ncbi:hypothetical protein [Nocardia niwae]|uniref:hypothetical protein n=1 Tax=Nocardia niwae TaxID=626084 RepID=UPI0033C2D8AB